MHRRRKEEKATTVTQGGCSLVVTEDMAKAEKREETCFPVPLTDSCHCQLCF